ncbi:hypothetical protein ACSNOH_14620 [Streptomyces sp. URMC 127]|uniref:baeRF2 domain-containing protein n=1 Tax=Streptomyces sp. URMC 127 TaxID=3423402 RepID=UPI003F1A90DB
MQLSFLNRLYEQPGPWASAYLDTSRDAGTGDADKAVALRWRHLRDHLAAAGADDETLDALADVVGADREIAGRHGQALFAARGRLVLVAELPDPPERDAAHFGPLPHALPLAVRHAPDIPYAAVAIERPASRDTGAPEDVSVEVESGRWPMSRVVPGASEVHRFASGAWQDEVPRIAALLTDMAGRGEADVIVLRVAGGDEWARGVLVNRLPRRVRDRLTTLPDDDAGSEAPARAGPGRALLEEQLAGILAGRMSSADSGLFDRYQAQRARQPTGSEGMPSVVAALQGGRAEALLVNDAPSLSARVCVGYEPTQIALSADELRAFRVPEVREEAAEDALLWSAMGTGAELVVVPRASLTLQEGVGVLWRY